MQGIFFTDIETVPAENPVELCVNQSIPTEFQERFSYEMMQNPEMDSYAFYMNKAGLYAEHGKIVSISVGLLKGDTFFVKTFTGRDEKTILIAFKKALEDGGARTLCGHYIKEFDGPWLIRRMLINGIELPKILQVMGAKTWEVPWLDTMEMWGVTQWKYRCSLDLLCRILGVPSNKIEMHGSDVAKLYYSMFNNVRPDELVIDKEDEVLGKISDYNAGDVIATARVFARLKGFATITDDQIKRLPV